MADEFEFRVTGDMTSALEKMLGSDAEAVLRAGGYAAASVYRDEAIRIVPVDSGTIQRNIIVKRIEERSDGPTRQVYYVTVRKGKFNVEGDAYYWRWVEYGHSYVRRKKKGVSWKMHRLLNELEYGTSSSPAQPFMRPAYDSKQKEAGQAGLAAMDAKFKILRVKVT
jgi:HK97 gp10 family phage protein